MASLALAVSVIFISVLLAGPITYILSLSKWIPDLVVYLLALSCIVIGIWWLFLPIPSIRYYGLVDIFCGYQAIVRRRKKITQG